MLVQQRLDAKGLLGAQVPRELVFGLAASVGSSANATHYAQAVNELARLRRMMLTAQRVVERGYEAGPRVRDFLEQAQQEVFGAAQGNTLETMKPFAEAMGAALDRLEAIHARAKAGLSHVTGVPTGLPWLDDQMLGLQPGTLVIVAARPSVGKTALALNIAAHAAVKGRRRWSSSRSRCPSDQLVLRLLCGRGQARQRAGPEGQAGPARLGPHHRPAASGSCAAPIWIDDTPQLSPCSSCAPRPAGSRSAGGARPHRGRLPPAHARRPRAIREVARAGDRRHLAAR